MARVEYIDYKNDRGSVISVTLHIHGAADRIFIIGVTDVTLRFVSTTRDVALYRLRVAAIHKYDTVIRAIENAANGNYELLRKLKQLR